MPRRRATHPRPLRGTDRFRRATAEPGSLRHWGSGNLEFLPSVELRLALLHLETPSQARLRPPGRNSQLELIQYEKRGTKVRDEKLFRRDTEVLAQSSWVVGGGRAGLSGLPGRPGLSAKFRTSRLRLRLDQPVPVTPDQQPELLDPVRARSGGDDLDRRMLRTAGTRQYP